MKVIIAVVLFLMLTSPVFSADSDFIKQWKNFLDFDTQSTNFSVVVAHFNSQARQENLKLNNKEAKTYFVYNVAFIDGNWLSVYIPYAPEDFGEIYEKCLRNKGYIKYLGVYTELPINPLCSETSSLDDLSVAFYFTKNRNFPYLSITTNGPACIPSWLYEFDEKTKKFNLVAEVCGG